jgi:flagellar biosynthesis/type III secretory pathway chaperone
VDAHNETEQLAELISDRHEVLVQLRELSRRQLDLIGEGDVDRLLVLLSAKQTLLGRLQKVDRRLDPFRRQDPESRRWRSPADRERTRQMAERCETLLGEIVLVEKQGESDLIRRRDEAATQLEGVHHASQARQAYGEAADAGGRLDLTSDG